MRAIIVSVLNYFPSLKRLLRTMRNYLLSSSNVSAGYIHLKNEDAMAEGQRLRDSWQDDSLPQKQRRVVELQLHQYRSGASIDVFDVFVTALRALPLQSPRATLLEIGCSSGFYSEVVDIAGLPINYSGCDYSDAFIRLAKEMHPSIDFSVADATALHYKDRSFDIVVSGCCLLHIPEYVKAIEETVRVARDYVIFHRTPIVWGQSEQWYRKQAYGVETVEIHFNEPDFLALLVKNGLKLIATHTLSEECADRSRIQGQASRTYVCRKQKQ
jgi:ubiquinone/menaquinone biosynthesis C-methylase UbiE